LTVFSGKLSWDVTTSQVNSALHPSGVAKSSTSFSWGKSGKVTAAGWQVISRSGVVISITNCYICVYFTLQQKQLQADQKGALNIMLLKVQCVI